MLGYVLGPISAWFEVMHWLLYRRSRYYTILGRVAFEHFEDEGVLSVPPDEVVLRFQEH